MINRFFWPLIGLILFLTGLNPLKTYGQETICGSLADTVQNRETIYHKDPRLDTLISETVRENKKDPKIEGYRIQIHYSSDRSRAREIENEFEQAYPNHNADLIYEQPYFKVRIGKFRNKIEAHKLYYRLKKDFSSAFIVPDEIELPEL